MADNFDLRKYLAENKLSYKSPLKVPNEEIQTIKTSEMLGTRGILRKEEYKDDVSYYIEFKYTNIPLDSKLEDTLGHTQLDQMVGKVYNTKLKVWNHLANNPENKFRIITLDPLPEGRANLKKTNEGFQGDEPTGDGLSGFRGAGQINTNDNEPFYKKMGFESEEEHDLFLKTKLDKLMDMIKSDPELLNVFKRLKDR